MQILDAGTIPQKYSTSRLIAEMEGWSEIGGICGEIVAMVPKRHPDTDKTLTFMEKCIGYAQYVEYKLAHYLDKSAESIFGFVSVLPGAFSAFWWKAIEGKPLEVFFSEMKKLGWVDCATKNMFLAEDRILGFEILFNENERYIL